MGKKTPPYKKPWGDLTPEGKLRRQIDVWIVKEVRRGKHTLESAAAEKGVSPESVVRNTGAFRKYRRAWIVQARDHISVARRVYVAGKELSIVTNDSREREKISQYFNAAFKLWYDGETEPLKALKGLTVKDEQGNVYELDTDPYSVQEIFYKYEEGEFTGPNSV